MPENEAVSTSSVGPATVRANGGMAIIDQVNQKYFNVKYLGWTSAGGKFRIYMKDAPKFKDGMLDLTGIKLRDNPILRRLLQGDEGNDPSDAGDAGLCRA